MPRRPDEPVRLTRIYTRTGDEGETSLGDLSRVPKTHPRVVAYGAVDELNAQLGAVLAGGGLPEGAADELRRVQNELFDLGADLSLPEGQEGLRVTEGQVEALERACDRFNEGLPALKSFVLPGGSEAAARLHVARTVCRRAELAALRVEGAGRPALAYLNRLSDLLFILARAANVGRGGDEPLWKPGESR